MRILIAYDGSPGAELAIKDMVRGAFPGRAEARVLTLADVWIPPVPPESLLSEHKHQQTIHDKASEILRAAHKTATAGAQWLQNIFPGWTVTHSAKADSPAWGIIAEARRWQADLIVIGSHGRKAVERFFLGSVSAKVAAQAHCSVRIVRPPPSHRAGVPRILLGIDGYPASLHAAAQLLARQWPAPPEILAITVVDSRLRSALFAARDLPPYEANIDALEAWIEPVYQRLYADFAAKSLTLQRRILEGDPKRVLLDEAGKWEVDTICLGASGMDNGHPSGLGTVASAIATRARCTVEIIRQPASTA